MIFTETWLNNYIQDNTVEPEGCTIFRANRTTVDLGKTKGGGLHLSKQCMVYSCKLEVIALLLWNTWWLSVRPEETIYCIMCTQILLRPTRPFTSLCSCSTSTDMWNLQLGWWKFGPRGQTQQFQHRNWSLFATQLPSGLLLGHWKCTSSLQNYINTCINNAITHKQIKTFPNQPWLNREVRLLLKPCHTAFRPSDAEADNSSRTTWKRALGMPNKNTDCVWGAFQEQFWSQTHVARHPDHDWLQNREQSLPILDKECLPSWQPQKLCSF